MTESAVAGVEASDLIPWAISRWNGADAGNLLPKGFPILYDEHSGQLCEPCIIYLYENFSKGLKNPLKARWNSLRSNAYQLKQWWEYLDEFGISWLDATPDHINGYAEAMENSWSPETGEPYAESTIINYITAVCEFYRWVAGQSAWNRRDLAKHSLIRLAQGVPTGRYFEWPEIKTSREKHKIEILLPHEIEGIFNQLGPQASKSQAAWAAFKATEVMPIPKSSRTRLACDIAIRAGLRIAEVCWLKAKQFTRIALRIEQMADTETEEIAIFGKGRKTRKVDFSGILLKQILSYIRGERAATQSQSDFLLLNPMSGKTRFCGQKTTPRTLQRAFRIACVAGGYTEELDTYFENDESASYISPSVSGNSNARFVFHELRHTYAVMTYIARKSVDEEPWLYIQQQLGHGSLQTTIGIYLTRVPAYEQRISDAYMESLRQGRRNG